MPSRPAINFLMLGGSASLSEMNFAANRSMGTISVKFTDSSAFEANLSRLTGSLISCAASGIRTAAHMMIALFIDHSLFRVALSKLDTRDQGQRMQVFEIIGQESSSPAESQTTSAISCR